MTRRWRSSVVAGTVVGLVTGGCGLALLVAASPESRWLLVGLVLLLLSYGACVAAAAAWFAARTRRRLDRLEALVLQSRKDGSRHEYIQEQALGRIERAARDLTATVAGVAWTDRDTAPALLAARPSPGGPSHDDTRVLFVTSNGGGMGHIARCSAVVRHSEGLLSGRILTLSTAADLVASSGFDVTYFPSQSISDRGAERWHRQFTRRLMREIAEVAPSVIVFDGTWVYPSLTEVAEFAGIPLVWLRRGLWRSTSDLGQVRAWQEHVTKVITPRDVAETEANAPEPFRDADWCDPISLAPGARLSRDQALGRLGLDADQEYALVQLSGGNGGGGATATAVAAIRAHGVTPVIVRSPLLNVTAPEDAAAIEARFPLVDYSAAWAFTVTGAGYNSVHENLHTLTPGIYLPSASTITDDQGARARAMNESGWGLLATDLDSLPRAVRTMTDRERRAEMETALRDRATPNGAAQAGQYLASVADEVRGHAWV